MVMKYVLPFVGPRLFRIYQQGREFVSREYVPNTAENIADMVIKWYRFSVYCVLWTSPLILPYLYFRNYLTKSGITSWGTFALNVAFLFPLAVVVRGFGRMLNKDYMNFVPVLIAAQNDFSNDAKHRLQCYDCEFYAWPVDYAVPHANSRRTTISLVGPENPQSSRSLANRSIFTAVPYNILSFIAAHTFGIRMVYPGKTALIQTLVQTALVQGREKLVVDHGGCRAKVLTADGNEIETMFVDRRNRSQFMHSDTLVVCCEGNAGFYEIGGMTTALDSGYSVMGWNHPGFGGSTGIPFPDQEQDAIDAVMQYAINKLGFEPHHIALYAWSIGGYTAAWAAGTYPEVKFLILDATFDDILPLAEPRMPEYMKGLVELSIRKYINLVPGKFLTMYPGPVTLIRRSRDEMITTDGVGDISTNRCNDLLIKLLTYRYPKLADEDMIPLLRLYLSVSGHEQAQLLTQHVVSDDLYEKCFKPYIEEYSVTYPMLIEAVDREQKEAMVLYLAKKYLKDFDSTHCVPLPATMFVHPWLTAGD